MVRTVEHEVAMRRFSFSECWQPNLFVRIFFFRDDYVARYYELVYFMDKLMSVMIA